MYALIRTSMSIDCGDAVAYEHTPLPSGKIGEGAPSPYFSQGMGAAVHRL